jgi:hypothetical protein
MLSILSQNNESAAVPVTAADYLLDARTYFIGGVLRASPIRRTIHCAGIC